MKDLQKEVLGVALEELTTAGVSIGIDLAKFKKEFSATGGSKVQSARSEQA